MSGHISYKIKKRIFAHEDLELVDSVQCISYTCLQDWRQILACYKALKHYPLPSKYVSKLKDFLLKPAYFSIYEITNPTLIIYRWPNGELRYFLISSEGFLLEPNEASTWDPAFPFLKYSSCNSQLSQLTVPIDGTTIKVGNWLWYPANSNYTHFFFDSFVQLGMAQEKLGRDYINSFELPVLSKTPSWQAELLSLFSSPICMHPSANDHQLFQIFHINKLLLPVLSHRPIALAWLRNCLASAFSEDRINNLMCSENNELIMVTRYDDRRHRITNIIDIENLVVSYGGKLIDASKYSISEKIILFKQCKVCIAESSGCMNFALFAPESSHLIALTDPSALTKPEFVPGGWVYTAGYASQTSFITGHNPADLPGSPLGSASYSLEAIKKLLTQFIFKY